MAFVFPALLGGLILVSVPVLLHLIMRQKPKHLMFPAFRFLMQRHRTNQRKLRLRHLALLALRVALIAAVCLALARPKVLNQSLNLSSDAPVAAVLVFDTSYSMEYTVGGRSRLDEAKRRAVELVNDLPEGSRVAVLDTAEPSGEWLPSPALARERLADLRLRPASAPVTSRLADAYRLFAEAGPEDTDGGPALPRFLYVFSDRTQECWDQGRLHDLEQLRERAGADVHAVFVDVGVDKPADLGIVNVELPRQSGGDLVRLQVTVRAVGQECDTEVRCRILGEEPTDRKPVKLQAGQSEVIVFERRGLTPGVHQAEVTLGSTDALPFDNARFVTFEVRGGRRVLILADDPSDAEFWKLALESSGAFRCDVRRTSERSELTPEDLGRFQAVCLLDVAAPDHDLWDRLTRYVRNGGGLAVIPGGEELKPTAYNDDTLAQSLLPGQLVKIVQAEAEPGVTWKESSYQHPIMAPFREWGMRGDVDFVKFPRAARRYWEVKPYGPEAYLIVAYADKEGRPALLERNFDRQKVRGRVLLYTTPLDVRHTHAGQHPWNDYLSSSFYLVLANKTVGYLAGDEEPTNFNYLAGQTVTVALPAAARQPSYTLEGPGLSSTETVVPRAPEQADLLIPQAVTPGNYKVHEAPGKPVASFSVNVPPGECQLERVPPEPIEALLGKGALLPVGHTGSLREALQGHWGQPVELFPWLMILVLLGLAVENLLANKFYRQDPVNEETPAPEGENG